MYIVIIIVLLLQVHGYFAKYCSEVGRSPVVFVLSEVSVKVILFPFQNENGVNVIESVQLPDFPLWLPRNPESDEVSLNQNSLVLPLLLCGSHETDVAMKYLYPAESTPRSVIKPLIITVTEDYERTLEMLQKKVRLQKRELRVVQLKHELMRQRLLKEVLEQRLMTQVELKEVLKQELEALEMQHKEKKEQRRLQQELEIQLAREKEQKRLEQKLDTQREHKWERKRLEQQLDTQHEHKGEQKRLEQELDTQHEHKGEWKRLEQELDTQREHKGERKRLEQELDTQHEHKVKHLASACLMLLQNTGK